MINSRKLVGLLCLLVMNSGLGASASLAATELAKINGKVLTLEEFNKKYRENLKFFQLRAPSKQSVLDDLIKRELAIQEAKREGLHRDPEVIDRMETVLFQSLVEKKLGKEFEKIHVTDDDARKFYDRNPEIRTSHIFVAVPAGASAEQQKTALKKIRDIQKDYLKPGKMSFAEVAQRYSEGVAAPMGGDIDYQTKDRLDPAYYAAALALKSPGKVSDVVRTQFGYHIIKLTGVRPWNETDQAKIKRLVFEEKRREIYDRFMNSLKSRAKVTIKTNLLSK